MTKIRRGNHYYYINSNNDRSLYTFKIVDVFGPGIFVGHYNNNEISEYLFDEYGNPLGLRGSTAKMDWKLEVTDPVNYDYKIIYKDGSITSLWCDAPLPVALENNVSKVLFRKNRDNDSIKLITYEELKEFLK